MLRFLVAFIFSLSISSAHAILELPSELFTIETLANEIRSPINLRLNDMIKNYRIEESSAGRVFEFRDISQMTIMRIKFVQILNTDNSASHEELEILDGNDLSIFKETIDTQGVNLTKVDILKRILMKDTSKDLYGLAENEKDKTIKINFNMNPFVTVHSFRNDSITDLRTCVLNEVTIGQSKVYTLKNTLINGSKRIFEYIPHSNSFRFIINGNWNYASSTIPNYRVEIDRPIGFSLDRISYYNNSTEFSNNNAFLTEFNEGFYDFYLTTSIHEALNYVINSLFPKVSKIKSYGANSRLLDELSTLLIQLDQAKTNPALLNIITAKIREIKAAIDDNLITITDNRSKP